MTATNAIPTADGKVTVLHNQQAPEKPKLTDQQKEAVFKTMTALADNLADVVTAELDTILVTYDRNAKDAENAPFALLQWAKSNVTAEKLAKFPVPGSKADDGFPVPDQYYEMYYRDGKKKFRQTSFYLKFFLTNVPHGKAIASRLAHIALAKDEKANQNAVPEEIRNLNPVDLEALREDTVKQQNRGVRAFRDAIALIKQFDAVNELKDVAAKPLIDKDGNIKKCAKPIKVWSRSEPDDVWGLYSLSGFMQFDPATASEIDGGTVASLKLTAKRDQGEDENDPATADAPVSINTNKTFAARLQDVHEFIENKLMADEKRELYTLFLKDHVNAAGSDDLIEALDDIRAFASRILSIPVVAARLEKISQRPAA